MPGIRTMDAIDDWTNWDDEGDSDWWLKHPLHHPYQLAKRISPRASYKSKRAF